jgi:hypothetical protein
VFGRVNSKELAPLIGKKVHVTVEVFEETKKKQVQED